MWVLETGLEFSTRCPKYISIRNAFFQIIYRIMTGVHICYSSHLLFLCHSLSFATASDIFIFNLFLFLPIINLRHAYAICLSGNLTFMPIMHRWTDLREINEHTELAFYKWKGRRERSMRECTGQVGVLHMKEAKRKTRQTLCMPWTHCALWLSTQHSPTAQLLSHQKQIMFHSGTKKQPNECF